MSVYKNFVVAGAGAIGKPIAEELLRLKKAGTIDNVVILTRAGGTTNYSELVALGAQIRPVDYSSAGSLAPVLDGADVVISTISSLGPTGLDAQFLLIEAAKAAGVKLFVPTEFGNDFTDWKGSKLSLVLQKEESHKKLQEIGLPYALFATGPWSDYVFVPPFGFDFDKGKVTIWGSGDSDISFTWRPDIARFVGYALTSLPLEKVENRRFNIEGERISLNALVLAYEAKSGKKLEVDRRPISELEARLKEDPEDLCSFLLLTWDAGIGANGKPGETANADFPDWNPRNVVDVLVSS